MLKLAMGEARHRNGAKEPAETAKESYGTDERKLQNNPKEHLGSDYNFYFLKNICHTAINLLKRRCIKGLRGGGRFDFYGR